MIPRIIHQIWIGDQSKRPTNCMETVKRDNPSCEYKLWTEKELKSLNISKKMELKIRCMKEINGKADIYRYLIMEKYGGVFLDADTISLHPLDDFFFKSSGIAFENEVVRPNLLACGFLAFPPNHPLIVSCIKHIESNPIFSPAWKCVANMLITNKMLEYQQQDINLYPSYYFYPEHHTGHKYLGHSKVYHYQLWGSTHDRYDTLPDIPEYLKEPKTSITITIPEDTSKKQVKEIMKGIRELHGHFHIVVDTKVDVKDTLVKTRFISLK